MTAQPWEPRVSRLEGAFEQSGDRLNSIDLRLGQIEARFTQIDARFTQIDTRFTQIDQKIDSNFKALIGWMLGQTAVVVGSMVAITFAVRH